jgi:hypothetical protein
MTLIAGQVTPTFCNFVIALALKPADCEPQRGSCQRDASSSIKMIDREAVSLTV